jgi:hypothetical protein
MASTEHTTKLGEIRRRHGNTLVGTLRKHYGSKFGAGCNDNEKLHDALQRLDEPSLTKLVRDYEGDALDRICRDA